MSQEAATWGRVAEDGTVYVITGTGERAVGQWPGGTPAQTLALFARRFDALEVEVSLLEQRVRDRRLTPDEATAGVRKTRAQVQEANAVGDLGALSTRLDALEDLVREQRAQRKAERARQAERIREHKEALVAKAEAVALGTDWRGGANRLRELLAEWKSLPRLDKPLDETLWRRISSARTAYSRRRKQHFAEAAARQVEATAVKTRLVAEAEGLREATAWGPTSARFRDLMQQWKAAGPATRADEEALWRRFRDAQERFFTARNTRFAEQDAAQSASAERKRALLVQAEALLPPRDARSAREAFRSLAEHWEQAGKVPKAEGQSLESRFRQIEQQIRTAENDRWRRDNPEGRARAESAVLQLESSIETLEGQLAAARSAGDEVLVSDVEESLAARRSWLEQARLARDEFSPA